MTRAILAAAFAGWLGSLGAAAGPSFPRVVLVGDSTMAPRTGYGNAFCGLFLWQVDCANLGRGGRSTKSYRADGSWERALVRLRERAPDRATYVLLQFGHNDQPGKAERSTDLEKEFPENLRRYVDDVRAEGAVPVLVTPLTRRQFRGDGAHADDLAPWAESVRGVARERGVALLDLHRDSVAAVASVGSARADAFAMAPAPHHDFDRTHLGPKGSAFFARMLAGQLAVQVPELAAHLVVGAVEPPGRIARPQLAEAQARAYSYREVLGDWDPLSDSLTKDDAPAPDLIVDPAAEPDGRRVFRSVQAAVNEAVRRGTQDGQRERIRILLRPGTYEELVHVPEAPAPITLYGDGPDATKVRIRAHAAVGAALSPVFLVRSVGFQAKNLTIENPHNKDRGDTRDLSQAVALRVEDADRAQFENVRLLGYQDTLFLAATSPARPPRAFFHRSYVEGDMDFIFGEATAYFLDTEVRSLGDRAVSYALAPSTRYKSRHGFVFERCRFTHDGTPNALAGVFKLARQWSRAVDAVGKVAILNSTIGEHIDPARPWADWSIGTPRHRRVQYDSREHRERLHAAGIDPVRDLGYPANKQPAEPFLVEYNNTTP